MRNPFKRRDPNAGNPNYNPGEAPGRINPGQYNDNIRVQAKHAAVVTTGFDDSDYQAFKLHYSFREQPDRGGALNYAYDTYGLPLNNVAGPFMVARHPWRVFGSQPLQYFPISVPTGIGTIPGQVISQPLLDPQGYGAGFDIYS
jgi:hypothetical protein